MTSSRFQIINSGDYLQRLVDDEQFVGCDDIAAVAFDAVEIEARAEIGL